jgi:diguanylate cyclase (GGDEF)-like protein/PAS domain S-box-containing protein
VSEKLFIEELQTQEQYRLIEKLLTSELQLQAALAGTQAVEERWELALEGLDVGVWDWNPQTDKVFFFGRAKEILGYAEHEFPNTRSAWVERLHPQDKDRVLSAVQEYFASKRPSYEIECRMRCKSGSWKWILDTGKLASRNADGEPLRMVGTHSDIDGRKKAEASLRIAATAFEAHEGMLIADENSVILRVNPAFTAITGYSAEEAIGQTPKLLSSGKHDKAFYTAMWDSLNNEGYWEGEIWNRYKSSEVYPGHLTITAVKDCANIVTNYVATFADITMSKAASDQIKNLAYYDSLTQLPNRRLLLDRLDQARAPSARSGQRGALLFLDLDDFKTLNDTLGHSVGDLLLQQVAERLTSCVRGEDTVSRQGGDEFVVLLEDLSEQEVEAASQTKGIAEKILLSLTQPYQLGLHTHHSTASIGVTVFNGQELGAEELLKQADIAMYQAKSQGRNALRFFDPKMQEAITNRADMEYELRMAIERNQFQLYYQVQVGSSGQILGAEVLIRWIHPERGIIFPINFISLAEETGLILPIGQWLLDTVCAQINVWQQNPLTQDIVLSVNVSAKQLLQINFVEELLDTVARYKINPSHIKLELTESMLVDNINDIITKINLLSKAGIRFSLDDFGTGYSSLQYLKILPLDQLKIDQSFVRDIATDNSDRVIVRTIITMADSLGVSVIAEGVETEEQRQYLFDNGCTHYQGYLFSKPLPIDEFEAFIGQMRLP